MKNFFISLSLAFIVIALFSSANAEVEIGFTRHSGWSDNKYLNDPNGWGIYLSKSLSPQAAASFSFTRFGKDFRYIGDMWFGFPPPFNMNVVSEFISSGATADFYEFNYHLNLVRGSKMRLETGVGLGWTDFDLRLRGDKTGGTMSASNKPMVLGFSVNLLVRQFIRSPFALRLGYQYRTVSTVSFTSDSFEPFREVKISSVNASILVRLWGKEPERKSTDSF